MVTQLDHDANVTPWVVAAEERGVAVDRALIRLEDGTLDYEHLESLLDRRTRLVAVTAASNGWAPQSTSPGWPGPPTEWGRWSTWTPSITLPTTAWTSEPSATCSSPRRTSSSDPTPACWSGGCKCSRSSMPTGSDRRRRLRLESGRRVPRASSLAGVTAAVDYLASLGSRAGGSGDRRALLDTGMAAVRDHEAGLSRRFLDGLQSMSGIRARSGRCRPPLPHLRPRDCGRHPGDVCASLAERSVFAWAGHYYALEPMQALGVLDRGGLVRIGFVHHHRRRSRSGPGGVGEDQRLIGGALLTAAPVRGGGAQRAEGGSAGLDTAVPLPRCSAAGPPRGWIWIGCRLPSAVCRLWLRLPSSVSTQNPEPMTHNCERSEQLPTSPHASSQAGRRVAEWLEPPTWVSPR